jgi:hypothetical protein
MIRVPLRRAAAGDRLAAMYNRGPRGAGLASLVRPPRTPIGGEEDLQRMRDAQRSTYRQFLQMPGDTGDTPAPPLPKVDFPVTETGPGSFTTDPEVMADYDISPTHTTPGGNTVNFRGGVVIPSGIPSALDHSTAPKRSDFGPSTEGGHIEHKQALNDWVQTQVAPPTVAPMPMAPPAAMPAPMAPPAAMPAPMAPPAAMPAPMAPPAAMPAPMAPPTAMPTPMAPPTAMPTPMAPPTAMPMPRRSDYGPEEGMDYRNDLRAYRESLSQQGYNQGGEATNFDPNQAGPPTPEEMQEFNVLLNQLPQDAPDYGTLTLSTGRPMGYQIIITGNKRVPRPASHRRYRGGTLPQLSQGTGGYEEMMKGGGQVRSMMPLKY